MSRALADAVALASRTRAVLVPGLAAAVGSLATLLVPLVLALGLPFAPNCSLSD